MTDKICVSCDSKIDELVEAFITIPYYEEDEDARPMLFFQYEHARCFDLRRSIERATMLVAQ